MPDEDNKSAPKEQLRSIVAKMDKMDYFKILGSAPGDDDRVIRKNFYARSRKYHPDRYHYVDDPEFVQLVTAVYKQVSEAYNVLKSPKDRNAYAKAIEADPDDIRFDPAEAASGKNKKEYDGGTGPGAKYYKLAKQMLSTRNLPAARTNIKLALTMESGNEHFQALQAEIENA